MTDEQIVALVARATDIILRVIAPAGASLPREEHILRQLSRAVDVLEEQRIAPIPEGELQAHIDSAKHQFKALRHCRGGDA